MGRLRFAAATLTVASAILSGCASRTLFPSSATQLTLAGELHRPESGGPFPAVVLLAPCGGISPHMGDWARWLRGQGYVAFIVDSFAPRGTTNACSGGAPTVSQVARDAGDAMSYLKTLPFVDSDRVAVIGWSHGAAAALEATDHFSSSRSASGQRIAFRAAVAFYPPCQSLDDQTSTPTLLLLAGADDWTPSGYCLVAGQRARDQHRPVSWEMYSSAQHAFDQPGPARNYLGHNMSYDAEAAAASHAAVQSFLAAQLQGKR